MHAWRRGPKYIDSQDGARIVGRVPEVIRCHRRSPATLQHLSRYAALPAPMAGPNVNALRRKHHELEQHRNRLERIQSERQAAMEQALRPADQRHAGQARAALGERAASLCAEQGRGRAPDLRLAVEAGGEERRERQQLSEEEARERARKCAFPFDRRTPSREEPMNRDTWMWMQASVALMANAAAAIRRAAAVAAAVQMPAPSAPRGNA